MKQQFQDWRPADRPRCECGNLRGVSGGKKSERSRRIHGPRYLKHCSTCRERKKQGIPDPKPYCERCGFVAEHRCQLDIDHKDGDHGNNSPENHWTLCSNCHRLKTHMHGDNLSKKIVPNSTGQRTLFD